MDVQLLVFLAKIRPQVEGSPQVMALKGEHNNVVFEISKSKVGLVLTPKNGIRGL